MAVNKPTLTKEGEHWVVRLDTGDGKPQVYRCATEQLGKQLIATLLATAQEPPTKPRP